MYTYDYLTGWAEVEHFLPGEDVLRVELEAAGFNVYSPAREYIFGSEGEKLTVYDRLPIRKDEDHSYEFFIEVIYGSGGDEIAIKNLPSLVEVLSKLIPVFGGELKT